MSRVRESCMGETPPGYIADTIVGLSWQEVGSEVRLKSQAARAKGGIRG